MNLFNFLKCKRLFSTYFAFSRRFIVFFEFTNLFYKLLSFYTGGSSWVDRQNVKIYTKLTKIFILFPQRSSPISLGWCPDSSPIRSRRSTWSVRRQLRVPHRRRDFCVSSSACCECGKFDFELYLLGKHLTQCPFFFSFAGTSLGVGDLGRHPREVCEFPGQQ